MMVRLSRAAPLVGQDPSGSGDLALIPVDASQPTSTLALISAPKNLPANPVADDMTSSTRRRTMRFRSCPGSRVWSPYVLFGVPARFALPRRVLCQQRRGTSSPCGTSHPTTPPPAEAQYRYGPQLHVYRLSWGYPSVEGLAWDGHLVTPALGRADLHRHAQMPYRTRSRSGSSGECRVDPATRLYAGGSSCW